MPGRKVLARLSPLLTLTLLHRQERGKEGDGHTRKWRNASSRHVITKKRALTQLTCPTQRNPHLICGLASHMQREEGKTNAEIRPTGVKICRH